jgi:hypothetical protein
MSKIALAADPSGTGTFTIASPSSDTNRTLTLPDVSGEVFSQGNILGTVTQSSGVPTGAIIERGSNANGEFVKYADGTLICTVTGESQTTTGSSGDVFRSSSGGGSTLPATFIAAPKCSGSPNSSLRISLAIDQATTTAVSYRQYGPSNSATGIDSQIIAIGRWF